TTVSTPLWGKLGDQYGRKIFFQAAIVIFLIGSILSGLSTSMIELIAFRAVQGLGSGGLMVGAQAIVGDIVSPRERGKYVGLFGGVFGLASVVGPLLVGLFVLVERRAAEPVLPLHLFKLRTFSVTSLVGFIVGFAMFGAITYLPAFFQVVRGISPTISGVYLLPLMAGLLLVSISSGQIIS